MATNQVNVEGDLVPSARQERRRDPLMSLDLNFHRNSMKMFTGEGGVEEIENHFLEMQRLRFIFPLITEEEIVQTAIATCANRPFRKLYKLDPKKITVAELREEFRKRFGDGKSSLDVLNQLLSCSQGQRSVEDFYDELHTLVKRLGWFPLEAPGDTIELRKSRLQHLMGEVFSHGLIEPIKTYLRLRKAESVQDMLKVAREEEYLLQKKARESTAATAATMALQELSGAVGPPQLVAITSQRPQFQQQVSGVQFSSHLKKRKFDLCFHCREPGHFARDCLQNQCHFCHRVGHSVRNCRMAPCPVCNVLGHHPPNCPSVLPN
jgi:hypothetical protein